MENNKIISNLYENMTYSYPFKDICCSHMNLIYSLDNEIDRKIYKIVDLEKWFESNFSEGEILITKRINEKGKYKFK